MLNIRNYKNLIHYIHNNPVKHGFTRFAFDYPWSSYLSILSDKPSKIKRKEVIDLFDDKENFKYIHQQQVDENSISQFIIE